MRDANAWYTKLSRELESSGLLADDVSVKEFFAIELGLYFLSEYYEEEEVGALWPLMSGYAACQPGEEGLLRNLRTRMGQVGRSNYFRLCLQKYSRLPQRLRGFERVDSPTRRVTDLSRFERQDVTLLAQRWEAYAAALSTPAPYRSVTTRATAAPGQLYNFMTHNDRVETVLMPDAGSLPDSAEPLVAKDARRREVTRIPRGDLAATASWIDEKLAKSPGAPQPGFARIWDDIQDCVFAPDSDELVMQPAEIVLDGVTHEVGLMNSGKSIKATLLTVEQARAGQRVTVVVESVMKAYEWVSLLRHLGLRAVPLIGQSTRERHAAAYWQSTLAASGSPFPAKMDPAARFATTACLLEPHRQVLTTDYTPLEPRDFPCRGQLRRADEVAAKAVDCPLLSVCPFQAAEREVSSAEVWVTTAQALITSKAVPATEEMRWLEACQHHADLVVVDEADRVQKVFDDQFVQSEQLVASDRGWTDHTLIHLQRALSRMDRVPMRFEEVQRFSRLGHELLEAVDELYTVLVSDAPANEQLRKTLDKNPFTGFNLLRRLSWELFGLPYGETVELEDEQPAEDFFTEHLEELALNPLGRPAEDLIQVTDAVLGRYRTDDDAEVLDDWLVGNAPSDCEPIVKSKLPYLRLLFQCALWSSRITTTFLQMSTLYPAVARLLELPDEESFWRGQPPADYDALVPEALMGNLMALQWTRKDDGNTGDLRLMWVRGLGRWLLHHLHDLLEPEGIDGPHVVLTSATSWMKDSSLYNIDIRPSTFLLTPPEDVAALNESSAAFLPATQQNRPVFISGRHGDDRDEAVRQVMANLLRGTAIAPSPLDRVRTTLDQDRQKVLFVTLSGDEAELAATYVNTQTSFSARHVVPNDLEPGEYGLNLRQVHTFGGDDADILVAAELAIQRGHNILNMANRAALGAVFYLVRPHPPASDLSFPLSLANRAAMRAVLNPIRNPDYSIARTAHRKRHAVREDWHRTLGRQVIFRRLRGAERQAFVANAFVSTYQTIGRSIRGGTSTKVFFCDAAFAPRTADPQSTDRDTVSTSLLVAMETHLRELLRPPAADASLDVRRDQVINTTLYQLAHSLFTSMQWPDGKGIA